MRGVTQRTTGSPYGECVRASYATLFGMPIALVPQLDPGSLAPGEQQGDREQNWLAMLGLQLIEVPAARAYQAPPETRKGLHLLSGRSPRGYYHRCVGMDGALVWDPHPSRAGLVTITSLGFVVPA